MHGSRKKVIASFYHTNILYVHISKQQKFDFFDMCLLRKMISNNVKALTMKRCTHSNIFFCLRNRFVFDREEAGCYMLFQS